MGELGNKGLGLLNRNKNISNLKNQNVVLKQQNLDLKEKKEKIVEKHEIELTTYEDSPSVFEGHDDFTIIPIESWRQEVRDSLSQKSEFFDLEAENAKNHFESPDFALGIFEYMKWREEKFEMKPYLSTENRFQTGFKIADRRTLVDWMVEFQEIQETNHETLYMAVRLCDHFFSRQKVSRDKLQLYAFVAFLLASKFEERWPPTFDDMTYLSEDTCKGEDFIAAELQMLKVLDFDINIPISYRYLRRYAKCIGMEMKALTVARFYLEATLQEYEYVCEKQAHLAAAALWIAITTLGYDVSSRKMVKPVRFRKKYWCNLLSYYTGLNEFEIIKLVTRMGRSTRHLQNQCRDLPMDDDDDNFEERLDESGSPICKIIYKKYASETFFEVAKIPLPSEEDFGYHERRCESERIDFEAVQEPMTKRRSSGGCTSRLLGKMTLRSSTTPNPPEPPVKNQES